MVQNAQQASGAWKAYSMVGSGGRIKQDERHSVNAVRNNLPGTSVQAGERDQNCQSSERQGDADGVSKHICQFASATFIDHIQ